MCGEDAGFPNVRASTSQSEIEALDRRFKQAEKEARASDSRLVLKMFQSEVSHNSKAIICRSLSVVLKLMSSDTELYNTYYTMLDASLRIPEDNIWDNTRESGDALLFPHYHKYICFAALSLNDRGVKGYGDHAIVLKTDLIQKRATVFHENSFNFVATRSLSAGKPIPPGYRAKWEHRDRLAVAKLGGQINSATTYDQFPSVLMDFDGKRGGDFIEVHIYGPIHRKTVEKVVGQGKTRRADACLITSLRRKLREVNVSYGVVK